MGQTLRHGTDVPDSSPMQGERHNPAPCKGCPAPWHHTRTRGTPHTACQALGAQLEWLTAEVAAVPSGDRPHSTASVSPRVPTPPAGLGRGTDLWIHHGVVAPCRQPRGRDRGGHRAMSGGRGRGASSVPVLPASPPAAAQGTGPAPSRDLRIPPKTHPSPHRAPARGRSGSSKGPGSAPRPREPEGTWESPRSAPSILFSPPGLDITPSRAPSPPSLRSRVRVTAIPILGTGLKIRRARQAAGHGAHGGTRGTRSRRLPARTGPPLPRGSPARGHRAGGVTATYSVDAEAGEEGEGAPQRLEASHPVWPATGAGGLVPGASLARGTVATRTSPAW